MEIRLHMHGLFVFAIFLNASNTSALPAAALSHCQALAQRYLAHPARLDDTQLAILRTCAHLWAKT